MASIYTREETETRKNKFEYKSYYQKNKARISRRIILLAISTGRCVSENTIHNPKYQWNDAEKERLRECIKRRRDSYLRLPIGQFQDRRYYINNQTDRRSVQRSPSKISPVNLQKSTPSPSNRQESSTKSEENMITDCQNNKILNRTDIEIEFSVKPPDDKTIYQNRLTEDLVIKMLKISLFMLIIISMASSSAFAEPTLEVKV